MVQRLRIAVRTGIRERAGAILQQIDVVAFAEGKELARKGAVVQRHVVGIDLRRARVRGREERILIFRGGGNAKGIVLRIDVQDEIVACLLHLARRRDRRGAVVRVGRGVGVVERARASTIIILKRAGLVLQQRDGLALVEREHFLVVSFDRHVLAIDGRRARVRGREEGILVLRIGGKVVRVVLRLEVQNGLVALRRDRARLRDGRGAGVGRAGVGVRILQRVITVLQLRGGRALRSQLVGVIKHLRHGLLRGFRRRGGIGALFHVGRFRDVFHILLWNLEPRPTDDADLLARGLCCDVRILDTGCGDLRIDLQRIRFDVRRAAAILPVHDRTVGKNDGRSVDRIHVQVYHLRGWLF